MPPCQPLASNEPRAYRFIVVNEGHGFVEKSDEQKESIIFDYRGSNLLGLSWKEFFVCYVDKYVGKLIINYLL